ncbi:MAG: TatD DNase family protein [Chthoniobacter sp.]|jgi:TatD DNase family protein|nr:TatD DNase family protein [Chthoniobacter sp.]
MLYDAHNHLHDARLAPHREAIRSALAPLDVRGAVVNGTREEDWEKVATLARNESWVRPSFGLHPWYVTRRSPQWLGALQRQLDGNPEAAVGEIGLDRSIEGHDLDEQRPVFTTQLALAAERNRAATIHCLQAWGALWDVLREQPVPARGFLLHAYGGPVEMIRGFVERGAYFSFSPSFLHPRKKAQREAFQQIREDRLLVETDAPDLRPPDARNLHPLQGDSGEPLNHPANLEVSYDGLAEVRGVDRGELEPIVARNYARLFL